MPRFCPYGSHIYMFAGLLFLLLPDISYISIKISTCILKYIYSLFRILSLGEGRGGGVGNLGVIVVRVCEPVFQNLPHSYT